METQINTKASMQPEAQVESKASSRPETELESKTDAQLKTATEAKAGVQSKTQLKAQLKTGVLLMNTGTPDAPTEEAARTFLEEMLSDPALISMPPFLWKPILHKFILPKRPQKTAALYKQIWTDEGAPFLLTSLRQRDLLQKKLDESLRKHPASSGKSNQHFGEHLTNSEEPNQHFDEHPSGGDKNSADTQRDSVYGNVNNAQQFQVEIGMRYGNPSIESGLQVLYKGGCERIILLPLYPQYAKVCSGTCLSKAYEKLLELEKQYGWKPQVIDVKDFFEQKSYIDGLVKSIHQKWDYKKGDKLVISFHSTLMADIKKGDPYKNQAEQTAKALADALNMADDDWVLSYQSRFDSRKWLSPFTADTVQFLGAVGTENVCIVAPGFVSDNLETSIELGQQMKELFLKEAERFGTENAQFVYAEALNDDELLIDALAKSILSA